MKKLLFSLTGYLAVVLFLFSNPLFAQSPVLPLDFESGTIDYTFTNFDGGGTTKITNPQSSGINTSANVGKMIKSAGQPWGGSWISMSAPIDFSVNKIFKVKVYMPKVGSKLTLKVENATDAGIGYEKEVVGSVANAWEELTFDYSTIDASKQYQKLVLIFDNGTAGDGSANFTYLFDDVKLTTAVQPTLTQMNLPVNFDSSTVNYGLVGFGGADGTIAVDPSAPLNKVAKVIKSATAETWAGTTVTAVTANVQTGFSSKIPFTATDTKMNVRIYSPNAGIKVRLKVEDYLDGTKSVETEATTTVANAWETLTFDFATQATGTAALNLAYNYNKASIFFNFGVTGATAGEKTYYFDDVKFGAGPVVVQLPLLPLDFESGTIDYTFTNFDGGGATKITNPQSSGINTSANVGKMVKSAGQTWGGSWISMASPIDFSVNKIFKIKVYMPKVGSKLTLKVENATNAGINYEKEVAGTVANAWEELTFDYSAIDASKLYQHLVLIFDNGTAGDGSANFTYLFDDVKLTSTPIVLSQMNLPVNFDSTNVNYGVVGFEGAEASSIITDPSVPTNKVVKVIKSATAQPWAGTTVTAVTANVQTGFSSKIPFTATDTKMNVRVYSPNAGIKVRLKVEDYLDGGKTCETEATSTVANAWETLTFDFATQATGTAALNLAFNYNKVSIFFNFGVNGATAGEKTYYFDDVKFGAAAIVVQLPVLPLDFESGTIDYTFTNFDGGGTTKITNPQSSGINTSANVGKMVKSAGQTWGGSWISMASPIDFSVSKIFKVKVYMPKVGSKLTLKVENATDAGIGYEKEVAGTVANAWEELTFDYSTIDASKQYQHLVLIFDNGTVGDGSANFTYLFDDVKLTSTQPVLSQMNLPVNFDSLTVNYGLVGFGGAEASTIVTDPVVATNKVAKVIKSATAELWAGTTVTAVTANVQTGFSSKIPFTATDTKMNVRVYSPNAGIKVRLKVEDYLDGTKSVETEATTTVANAWETLTFDFATQATGTAALNLAYNYNKASIFFNFGVTGATAGEKTYYFDDVKFGAPAVVLLSPVLPLDFESKLTNYTFTNFDGGAVTVIANSQKSGIDTSANVGKMVKSAGQFWGGAWISLAAPIDFSVNKTFKVKVFMPKVGAKLLLKVENQTDGTVSYEKEAIGTVANAWEELTIDYSAINTTKQYQKLVLIFDMGTIGDGSANFTYLFDDVKLVNVVNTDVTFRVNMKVQMKLKQFDKVKDTVIVRGTFYQGVGNWWDANNLKLTDADGDSIYVGTFAAGAAPQRIKQYKYVMRGLTASGDRWEVDMGLNKDRTDTIPSTPWTLPVVWFNNDSTSKYSDNFITFQVNMKKQMKFAKFDKAKDSVVVRGDFNGWGGNTHLLADPNTDSIYTGTFNITSVKKIIYKFVIHKTSGDTWESSSDRIDSLLNGSPRTEPVVWFTNDSVLTGVRRDENAIVTRYELLQNYPNPFNPATSIDFTLLNSGWVKLTIYNVVGQEVTTIVNQQLAAGKHTATFNARDLTSGVYFYRLTTGTFTSIKKMMLLK